MYAELRMYCKGVCTEIDAGAAFCRTFPRCRRLRRHRTGISESVAPELHEPGSGLPQQPGHSGKFEDEVDELEKPVVQRRREQQQKQQKKTVRLELRQGSLGLWAQMRLQRVVAVQAGNRQQVEQQRGDLQEAQERPPGPQDRM